MRISLRPSLLAAGSYAAFGLLALPAQEPKPAPTPPPTAEPPAPPLAEGGDAQDPEPPKPGKPPMLVVEAGTVHPVAGPAITNGVVVIDGERIVAVGKKGEVEVAADAIVRSFPTGHVYPGLVDAATDAFTDAALRTEAGVDAGTALADVLQRRHDRDDELVAAGITTAYVTVRSPGVVRPQGAIVRPTAGGFEPWSGHEHGAVQLRMTNGPGPTHALQRQQMQQQVDALFDGLEDYAKALTDHEEALKKYAKEFEDYLAWHKKKKDEKAGDKPADKKDDTKAATPPAADAPPSPPEGRRRVRPGGGGGGGGEPPKAPGAGEVDDEAFAAALGLVLEAIAQDPPKQDPGKQDPKPGPQTPPGGGAPGGEKPAENKDEAPKRPTWPKAPPRDPQKDTLQRVLDGALPLRVEVHRADEVRAALQMQRRRKIPVLVLEQAYGAGECADQLGERGTSTVLTDLLPADLPESYDGFDPAALAAKLQAAGVPFAIATGSARRAPLLPMMAAAAVGRGLDRDAALRAITLTPAEILGVATDVGSLQKGKLADVLVCDRPLFASDSHVLLVLQKGRTAFETK
ncbi:MAG: amidohydrolase family protein [Planctomycetes bacterium]|nr:amidohydrolase family protein [Planctomycetota bacterium]